MVLRKKERKKGSSSQVEFVILVTNETGFQVVPRGDCVTVTGYPVVDSPFRDSGNRIDSSASQLKCFVRT